MIDFVEKLFERHVGERHLGGDVLGGRSRRDARQHVARTRWRGFGQKFFQGRECVGRAASVHPIHGPLPISGRSVPIMSHRGYLRKLQIVLSRHVTRPFAVQSQANARRCRLLIWRGISRPAACESGDARDEDVDRIVERRVGIECLQRGNKRPCRLIGLRVERLEFGFFALADRAQKPFGLGEREAQDKSVEREAQSGDLASASPACRNAQ